MHSTYTQPANEYLYTINANMSKHFIFNTLNNINSFIVENDTKLATDYVSKFGKLLRLILENNNSKTISLNKELEALQLYILLEKMRYSNMFELEIHIAKDIDTQLIQVPPLVLQPYIEHAIWQNIACTSAQQNIQLHVSLLQKKILQYKIIETKSNAKPKLMQAPLPHMLQQQISNSQKWVKQNASLFEVEVLDLYNNGNEAIAQKTIITLALQAS